MDRYATLRKQMGLALDDLRILSGDSAGSGVTWQDVAGTAAVNLRALADMLDSIRKGETHHQGRLWTGTLVFPSPDDLG